MFHVKRMSNEDLGFAVRAAAPMNWGLVREDFELMMRLEQNGCFVLLSDSERAGIATTISYGTIGWFGNLVVDERHRGKGAGSLLVKHSLDYLVKNGVKTVGLYAYVDRIPFYERLGFKLDSDFVVLKGHGSSMTVGNELTKVEKRSVLDIVEYDQLCFGASRKKLLEPLLLDPDNLCYMSVEKDRICGYALAKVYTGAAEIGPLVCNQHRTDVAVDLLRTLLSRLRGFEVSICVQKKETKIINMLLQAGFGEDFYVARMFFGLSPVNEWIYAAESLERG